MMWKIDREAEAYESFLNLTKEITGCYVSRTHFLQAYSDIVDSDKSYGEAFNILRAAYRGPNLSIIHREGLTWENLKRMIIHHRRGELWAMFLRKEHNEEVDKR